MNRNVKLLILFYLISHGMILFLMDAIYWDDWVLWNMNESDVFKMFDQAGSPLNIAGYLHTLLLSIGPWLYKLMTFTLNLMSGLILYSILKKNKYLNVEAAFYIALLFIITPLFIVRVTLIAIPYTIATFSFLLAWYMLDRNRIISLILFIISFNIPSFLVFYAVPIMDWYFRENDNLSAQKILNWGYRHLDFLIIPFLWYVVYRYFFTPYGFYEGYNQSYDLQNLFISLKGLILDNVKLSVNLFLMISGVIVSYFLLRNISSNNLTDISKRKLIVISSLVLFFAWFPYGILGYSPQFQDWNSRHQLLLQFGISFLIFTVAYSFSEFKKVILILFIAVSLSINVTNYSSLFLDWNKQKQIMLLMNESEDIKDASTLIFTDFTIDKNALDRIYRTYEWNGMLKYVFDDEKRFGISDDYVTEYFNGDYDIYFDALYAAGEHERGGRVVEVDIKRDGYKYYFIVDGNHVEGNFRLSETLFKSLKNLN